MFISFLLAPALSIFHPRSSFLLYILNTSLLLSLSPSSSSQSTLLLSLPLSLSRLNCCPALCVTCAYVWQMEQRRSKQAKTEESNSQEVSSIEWKFIKMTHQEEDLIYRMHRLVGDRWDLIAGRIPGRKAEEIERFWIMRHCEIFAERRKEEENAKNL